MKDIIKLSLLATTLAIASIALRAPAQVVVGAPNYYGFFEIAATSGTNVGYLPPISTATAPGLTNCTSTAVYDLRYSPHAVIALQANSTNSVPGNGTAGTITLIWATSANGTYWDVHPVTGTNTIPTQGGGLTLSLAETNTVMTFTNLTTPPAFIKFLGVRGVGTNAVLSITPKVYSRIQKN